MSKKLFHGQVLRPDEVPAHVAGMKAVNERPIDILKAMARNPGKVSDLGAVDLFDAIVTGRHQAPEEIAMPIRVDERETIYPPKVPLPVRHFF